MNKKLLITLLVGVMALALVSAVATYYALVVVSLNVQQPIIVAGALTQESDCDAGDTCLGKLIAIRNIGDSDRVVTITDNSGENIETSYVGILELTSKETTGWTATEDLKATLTYTIVGDTFEYDLESTLDLTGYTLIYYKDAVVGLEGRLENPQPTIEIVSEIGVLPQSDDANILADYSQAPDGYLHSTGAKLWLVPTSAILDGNVLDWSMWNEFLYETDLIWYSDSANELTIPANGYIEFYPQFEVNKYASDGVRTIQITIA